MPIMQAKCTNCGGILAIDDLQDAAVCPFCNMPFVVEKAITNYNINGNVNIQNANITVSGAPSVENLLLRAKQYFAQNDFNTALEYINRVLDVDANNQEALNLLSYYQAPSTPNLTITRKSSFSGSAAVLDIYIDGYKIGSVSNGQTAEFIVYPGKHTISFKNTHLLVDEFMNPQFTEFVIPTSLNKAMIEVSFKTLVAGLNLNIVVM